MLDSDNLGNTHSVQAHVNCKPQNFVLTVSSIFISK